MQDIQSPVRRSSILESRGIDYVPRSERHGKVWHQGPFWFASNFVVLTMAVGFTGPASGLGLGWSSIAALLGSIAGAFFMAFHANQGPQMGIPQMIQSRAQFGSRGVIIPLIAALFVYVGFNVFDVPMATDGFRIVVGGGPTWPWFIGIVVVQCLIAIAGYDLIHSVQRWLTYLLVVSFAILTVGSIDALGGTKALTLGHFSWVGFLTQFAAAAGYMIAYAIYVSDYTRYLPANTRLGPLICWTFAGVVVAGAWLMSLGALFAIRLKDGANVTSIFTAGNLAMPGLGTAVMLISSIALVTVMAVNTYGATLVTLTALDGFWRLQPSVKLRAGVSVLLSSSMLLLAWVLPESYQDAFSNFLALILYFLVPWSSINLVDYYWIRRGQYSVLEIFEPAGIYGRWAWRGLLAYATGFIAMLPFFVLPFYVGPVARMLDGIDISFAVGLPVSAVVYYWLTRSLNFSAEAVAYRASAAALESS